MELLEPGSPGLVLHMDQRKHFNLRYGIDLCLAALPHQANCGSHQCCKKLFHAI